MAFRKIAFTDYETEISRLKQENSLLKKRLRDRDRIRKKPTPDEAVKAIESLKPFMRDTATEIVTDRTMRELVTDVLERRDEFRADHVALLAGIGMNMKAREHFDQMLDREWAKPKPDLRCEEVIVGGGLHAAIYAACRVKLGFPEPLVIERSTHPGGVFACSRRPTFYLNSRNKPGNAPSIPGDNQPLNYLPGCDLQPADMGGGEYQSNDLIAWVIRCNLALNATVWSAREVCGLGYRNVSGPTGRQLARPSRRIIVATGPGTEKRSALGVRTVTFSEFMGMMDNPFPLKRMRRVAVIGAGDAGKTVIEALSGQGPVMLTANSLDYPEIHWYGVPDGQRNRTDWEKCNRSRYKGIGRLLVISEQTERSRRVVLKGRGSFLRAETIENGLSCAYVDGRPYDLVVQCFGFNDPDLNTQGWESYLPGPTGSSLAGKNGGNEHYSIGVCAKISPSAIDQERFKQIGENGTSIFYLARKTEGLALRFN